MSMNIYQRLAAVMSEVTYIQKDQRKIDGKYTAVRHDDVVAKVRPALLAHGIIPVATVEECSLVREVVTGKFGDRSVNVATVKLSVRFVSSDDPSDTFCGTFWGQGEDSGDKAVGKAISYAYKYALLKTLMLETGDDSDHDASIQRTVVRPAKGTDTPQPPPSSPPARRTPQPVTAEEAQDPNHPKWKERAGEAWKLVKAEKGREAADAAIAACTTHQSRLVALNDLLCITDPGAA
jgi:hypothetical protein